MIFEVHVKLEDSYGTDIEETLEIPTDLVEGRSETDLETYIEDKVNDWFYDTTAEIFHEHWVELEGYESVDSNEYDINYEKYLDTVSFSYDI